MHSLNQPIHPSIVQPPNLANHHGHRHSHSLVPISLVYIHIRITRSRSVRFGCDLCELWARVMSIGPFTVVHITRTLLVLIGPMVLCRLLEATDLVLFCLPTPLGALSLSDFCAPRGKFTLNTTIVSIAQHRWNSYLVIHTACCHDLLLFSGGGGCWFGGWLVGCIERGRPWLVLHNRRGLACTNELKHEIWIYCIFLACFAGGGGVYVYCFRIMGIVLKHTKPNHLYRKFIFLITQQALFLWTQSTHSLFVCVCRKMWSKPRTLPSHHGHR